jgi:poly(A) polymerase
MTLRNIIPPGQEVYLVGGTVRDAYLHRPFHDIDLATPNDGRPLARQIADALKGAYYPLDAERGVGRVVITQAERTLTIDVAQFRGPDLMTDLKRRDFTLNAVAVPLTRDLQTVIDPLDGLSDLQAKRLRQCNPSSIADDPARALRAVRLSHAFGLRIEPDTRTCLKKSAARLASISVERVRDEFFQILDGPRPSGALTVLYHLDLLAQIVPEISTLSDTQQGPPHQLDVWQHTLLAVECLDNILGVFASHRDDNLTANLQAGLIAFSLGHLRDHLQAHLAYIWPNGRTHRALLVLAALLHDIGKPQTRSIDDAGRVRFVDHERKGEQLAEERARALRLSNDEIARLTTIVRHHMRPHWLNTAAKLTPRAVYRFWRDTNRAGVDICLLAMADYLATYGVTLETQNWTRYLSTIRTLLEGYFLHHESAIAPPPLVTGKELLAHFGLQSGPQVGELLEHIREAQIDGEITSHEEALNWVQRYLNNL